jgi:hypothetical protein
LNTSIIPAKSSCAKGMGMALATPNAARPAAARRVLSDMASVSATGRAMASLVAGLVGTG